MPGFGRRNDGDEGGVEFLVLFDDGVAVESERQSELERTKKEGKMSLNVSTSRTHQRSLST